MSTDKTLREGDRFFQFWRADLRTKAISRRIRELEKLTLPLRLDGAKPPQRLVDLYDKRAKLQKERKTALDRFEEKKPEPPFPDDWTTDPRQLLAKIRRVREILPDTKVQWLPFDRASCPGQSLRLSIAPEKLDLPVDSFVNPLGYAIGNLTMDPPWDSQIVRFTHSIEDWSWSSEWDPEWPNASWVHTETFLEFPFVLSSTPPCPDYTWLLWGFEVTGTLSFDWLGCELASCYLHVSFELTQGNFDPLANPRLSEFPSHDVVGQMRAMAFVGEEAGGMASVGGATGRQTFAALGPAGASTQKLVVRLTASSGAVDGNLSTSGRFEIRPDPAIIPSGWGVGYVAL